MLPDEQPSPSSTSPPSRKRTLSNASSTASKRAHSEDPKSPLSGDEGSLGASHLHIMDSEDTNDSPNLPSLDVSSAGLPPLEAAPAEDLPPPAYDANSPVSPQSSPPDPIAQIEIIKDLKRKDLVTGESWWLVSRVWYRRWQAACSGIAESKEDDPELGVEAIGPIDNSSITGEDGQLKPSMGEGVHVELLPEAVWQYLLSWYGSLGQTFERRVVSSGAFGSERVEFYPPRFHLFQVLPSSSSTHVAVPIDLPTPPTVVFSCGLPLKHLKAYASAIFRLTRPVRLWRLPDDASDAASSILGGSPHIFTEKLDADGAELIEVDLINDDSTLSEALLDAPSTRLAVEQQTEDGSWLVDARLIGGGISFALPPVAPVEAPKKGLFADGYFKQMENTLVPKYKSASAQATTSKATTILVPSNAGSGHHHNFMSTLGGAFTRSKSNEKKAGQRGLTGLQNLGNTCFMNSALQCMSNTKELQEYFHSGVYKNELNPDNPLGMNGQVAEAFGALIERLWSSSGGAVAPREFKQALSKFAPSFSGYGQQDSQELLAFLLDGTHEDLNRIKVKPATSAPDWNGGDDRDMVELAKTCWEQYRSRNDSVIVDLFQGQYRSTVVCPDCDKVSITFDPFMYVTTNLPVQKLWSGKVYFVPLDSSKPRYSIELELAKTSQLKAIKTAIGNFMSCDPKKLVMFEEWNNDFHKEWHDDEMITEVKTDNDNLVFFETLAPFPQPKPRYYGKTKPTPPPPSTDEPPIILAVRHTFVKPKASRRMFGSSNDTEVFGAPFLLSLTPAQASTVAGIQKALAIQYARVTKRGDEIVEAIEELDQDDEPVDITPDSVAPPASVPLPDTPPCDSPMDVDLVEGAPPSPPADDDNNIYVPTVAVPPPHSSLPLPLPLPSIPKRRLPFRVLVTQASKKGGKLAVDKHDSNVAMVPLESRVRSSSPDIDIFPSASQTTLPGSFVTVTDLDEDSKMDSVDSEATSSTEVEPEVPAPPAPLVRTGDLINVEWQPDALEYFFGEEGKGENAVWSELTAFVDPAVEAKKGQKRGQKKVITIQDCLREFTKEERLGEDDTWYCPDCKKHQQATKKVEIWKVPDVLVFALKRFSSSRYSRDKIDDNVDFPVEGFDMEPFVEGDKVERRLAVESGGADGGEPESLIYDLYAVDNHYGGMGGGHYTAYAKNHENGKWYDFDDGRVGEIRDPEKVRTPAAYLLFYRRRTTRPIGAKSRELVDSALQSRNSSAPASDHVPSPSLSLRHSPFSSTEAVDLFGDDDVKRDYHPRFMGIYPRPSSVADSDTEAEQGTPPGAREELDWEILQGPSQVEEEKVEDVLLEDNYVSIDSADQVDELERID